MEQSSQSAVAVRGELIPAGLRGPLTNQHLHEYRQLSAADRALITPEALQRWVADLADDDYTLSDIAVFERKRRMALRTLRDADLTETEYKLLRYLQRHEGKTCTYIQLARHMWATPERSVSARQIAIQFGYASPMISTIQNLVHHIRRKLEVDPARPQHLATIRQVGYRWYSAAPSLDDGEDYEARSAESAQLREQLMLDLGITDPSVLDHPAWVEGSSIQLGPQHPEYQRALAEG